MIKFCGFLTLLIGFLIFIIQTADQKSPRPYGLKERIPWTTSRIAGTPEPPPPYQVTRAFPKQTFKSPVFIAQEPGTDRLMVAELKGKIYAFDQAQRKTKTRRLFLDTDRQIYAFSFHPNYETNGHVFVFSPRPGKSRVSRFVAKGKPRKCDIKSEKIIVEWKSGGHNGGEAIIGPDGYLYIATGDSTSTSDGANTGQGVNDLLSVIMRIDVDNPAKGKAYSIPKDNPFVNLKGARPEIWAFGFRNPWRMSFDERNGRLWVGDVGQDLWEMIRLIRRGGNYGWSVQEGSHPFHPNRTSGPGPILPPIVEHHHLECRSITGGYVYYGQKFPELKGVYFYGDHEYGKIWGLKYDPANAKRKPKPKREANAKREQNPGRIVHDPNVVWHKELADSSRRIVSFGVSRAGDIYLLDHSSGGIYELQRAKTVKPKFPFPRKLSDTGLFASVKNHQVAAGVMPFSVNTPGWLDGAVPQRFLALPKNAKISVPGNDSSAWSLDDGAVTVQTVSLDMEAGNPNSRRRIETRIMVRQESHWLGYSYLWNKEQTDGVLVNALGKDIVFDIKDETAPGGKRRQTWHIPSRNECMFCHSRAAGFVLGLRTIQMNRDHNFGEVPDNQLRTYNHIGLFKKPIVEQSLHGKPRRDKDGKKLPDKRPRDYQAIPNAYDAKADLNARARGYLHVHCSICHDNSGGGNSKFQIRYDIKLDKTNLLNQNPIHGDFGLRGAKLIQPGDPFASVLFYRFSKLGSGRMPHIGSNVHDERGLDLLHEWISQLSPKGKVLAKKRPQRQEYASALKELAAAANLPPRQRAGSFGKQLTSARTAFMISRLLRKEKSLAHLRDEITSLGVAHGDVNIRDLFERFIPEAKRTKRLGNIFRPEEILARTGNADAGRKFFFTGNASLCRACHQINKAGGTLGPDLSQIGKKYKRPEILESLIYPSKKIEEKYKTHLIVTTDGKTHSGIVVEKNQKRIVLNVLDGTKTKSIRIPADQIDQLLPQKKSTMPDGLLRDMTAQQAADLLAYLASLR